METECAEFSVRTNGGDHAVGERASEGPTSFSVLCHISIRKLQGIARASASDLTICNTNFKIALAVVAGATLGAAAMEGLHAQAKPKAYSVAEVEILNTAGQADYLSKVRTAIEAAHGHAFRTLNGRVVSVEGSPPPQHAAIVEWDSVDDAVAFYHSKAWTDFAPLRDKSQKTIRRYVVEAEK